MKKALLLILLLSLSFAGEAWKVDTGDGVSERPLAYGARVIAVTDEGRVYSIAPPLVKWTYNTEGDVVSEPLSFAGSIIVPTSEKIVALDSYGALKWEMELPEVTGAAVSDKLYVADANGIQALNADGTIAWNFMPGSEVEGYSPDELQYAVFRPLATESYVAFGYGRSIYVLRTTGDFMWKKEIGGTWNTPPAIVGNTLYVGTAEGLLYALDVLDGDTKSSLNLFGQISTSPVLYGSMVIVGTSENAFHGVSGGKVQWTAELDGKAGRTMELHGNTLYLSTTRSLYAVNPSNGEILFKRSFLDWPSPPRYFAGEVVVGTEDGKVYSVDSDRACSILYPMQDSQVGDALLNISGLGYSASGSPSVQLRVNGGPWVTPEGGREWTYALDPSGYPYGIMEIECKAQGESSPYTLYTLVHAANLDTELMTITCPYSVAAGTEFAIRVTDSRSVPVGGVAVSVGGETFSGDENGTVLLSLPEGPHTLKVERPGYASEEITIDAKGEPTLAYVLGGLFAVVLIAYVYFLFIKKPKKKEFIIAEKHPTDEVAPPADA